MATSIFKEYFKGYEILGELGRGNARVLKARSLQTGELVAIKHFAFNSEPDALRRFQRESEIMKSIRHENIVKIIEVHLDAELPYIVMQLVEGGDLRSLLKEQGTLDIPTIIQLAHHLTEALEAIHEKEVVHRDIKPENIMFRRLPDGELRFLLTDFGIAKLREQTDPITVTGASMLTYDYASPEQFNHSRTVAAPTDYYSMGVVLYECLTGAVPFEFHQEDLLAHIHRVISSPIPALQIPGLPPSLQQLIHGLLTKLPGNRLSDPVGVDHLLRMAAFEDRQGVQSPSQAGENKTGKKTLVNNNNALPAKPPERKRKKDLAIIAGLLMLISSAVFFSWKSLEKPNAAEPIAMQTRNLQPLVLEVKHNTPVNTDILSNTYNSYTPAVVPAGYRVQKSKPGISLINGIYYDDFSNQQDSMWDVGIDETSEYNLADGKYIMKGLSDSLSYSSAIKFNIDINQDFTISANTTHASNKAGDPFGISFCGDETQDSYFVFYITSNGYYSIGTAEHGNWNLLVNWTESSNIRPDSALNILTIEKQGDMLRFLINDRLEKILPFTGGFGSYFGLRVDGAQTVLFDQFIVKGINLTNNQ